MFPKSILPLFLLCSVAFAAEYSPVLLFGGSGQILPALSLVSSKQFVSIASAENAMNVIFVEKNGKPESFLDCTTVSGETCFTGLKTIQGKTYYRQVDSPVAAIKGSAGNCQVLSTNTDGELIAPIDFAPNTCVIVNLFGEIQAHDALITKFLEDNKNNKIVALYTPSVEHSRTARAVKARVVPDGSVFYNTSNPGFAIFFEKVQLCILADKINNCKLLTTTSLTTTQGSGSSFNASIATNDETIAFEIIRDNAGYFEMQNLKVGQDTFRVLPEVQAPTTFSYFCGNKTFYQFGADKTGNPKSLVFNMLQMQAPFHGNMTGNFTFGDPWHCVPFVSIPILAGLFVSAIMLAILGVGICWLMDINTMDRFDDPKGKTITINAGE